MPPPAIDPAPFRALLRRHVPDLMVERMDPLPHYGWGGDSDAWLVNGDLVFRFPRGPAIAAQLAVESRLLPELAPSLPLAVPRFEYLPRDDTTGLPIFAGYRAIPGEPLTPALLAQMGGSSIPRGRVSPSPHAVVSPPAVHRTRRAPASPSPHSVGAFGERPERPGRENPSGPGGEDLPAALGAFLAALHAFPVNRARELGAEEAREPDHTRALFESVREYVYPRLTPAVRRWTDHLFGDYLANPRLWEFTAALVHGDLSSDHILYDRAAGRLGGIIDFGDAGIYDPISDFVGLIDYGDAFLQAALAAHAPSLDPLAGERLAFYRRRVPFIALAWGAARDDAHALAEGMAALRAEMASGS